MRQSHKLFLLLWVGVTVVSLGWAGNPFVDDPTPVGVGGAGSAAATARPGAGNGSGAGAPVPPSLEAPPSPGAKGVTTASPQFATWLAAARKFIDAWDFPTDVVNKYGQTITRDDFLKAIIWIESNGVHRSPKGKLTTSYVGALGFMQLMPATAKGMGYQASDPGQNLLAGTRYIKEIFKAEGVADAPTSAEKLIKACVAYNAGPYSNFTKRPWDKLKMGKNYETIGYGLKLKMCLGLDLTETEKGLVAKVLEVKTSRVPALADEYYANANGLF